MPIEETLTVSRSRLKSGGSFAEGSKRRSIRALAASARPIVPAYAGSAITSCRAPASALRLVWAIATWSASSSRVSR